MGSKRKQLILKQQDFRRFMAVLLIIGTYLYLGAITVTYIQPENGGTPLFVLSLLIILSGLGYGCASLKIKIQLENEHN
ncbi:YrhC family protein [Virgibacillus kimchii]